MIMGVEKMIKTLDCSQFLENQYDRPHPSLTIILRVIRPSMVPDSSYRTADRNKTSKIRYLFEGAV